MESSKHVIIIGGGLAGLSAAVRLAESGFRITLLERRPYLGGRASSYPVSPSSEELVDNCQHVLLKSCTNLIDFYRRIDSYRNITFFDRIPFLDERARLSFLKGSILPAPLHMLPSFLRFKPLEWKDRFRVMYALSGMLRERQNLQNLDGISMLDWLQKHKQTDRTIEAFWRVVLVSALNEDIEVVSARYGIQAFLDGVLKQKKAFHVGIPSVPLSRLYTEPSLKFLGERNAGIRLRCQVKSIEVHDSLVQRIELKEGAPLAADYYVSSVPPDVLLRLLPESVVNSMEVFGNLRQLQSSPITAVYLWLDRKVTDLEYAALPGRQLQWMFNKSPDRNGASQLGLVVSASRKLLPLGRSEILEQAVRELKEIFPAARQAEVVRGVVIKEPFATFSCRTGSDALRPDQQTPIRNLFVAGDWTRTGWPPTMEGAVRSGYRCAELILTAEGIQKSLMQPDLPPQGVLRFLKWNSL